MRVFRLCKAIYSDRVLSGEGGVVADGRWHSAGRLVVYTASAEALAVLELRVHLGRLTPQVAYTMHVIELPDGLVESVAVERLPAGWQATPPARASQAVGDEWLTRAATLALRLPSIHSRSDFNVLLNPAHPDIRRAKVRAAEPYAFDARLF